MSKYNQIVENQIEYLRNSKKIAEKLNLLDFGNQLKFFNSLDDKIKKKIVMDPIFSNWFLKFKFLADRERISVKDWVKHFSQFIFEEILKSKQRPFNHIYLSKDYLHVVLKIENEYHSEWLKVSIDEKDFIYIEKNQYKIFGIIKKINDVNTAHGLKINPNHQWIHHRIDSLNNQPAIPPYPKKDLKLSNDSKINLKIIEEALSFIEKYSKNSYLKIKNHVKLIVPFDSKLIVGWTDYFFQGCIFLNIFYGDKKFLVERIVHEAAHAELYMIMENHILFNNKMNETFQTPLRKDPRPASGLYHQSFVSQHVAKFMLEVYQKTKDDHFLNVGMKNYKNFEISYDSLISKVDLTDYGKKLLFELKKELEEVLEVNNIVN